MSLAWWRQHAGKFWLAGVYSFFYLPLAFLVVFSFNSTRQDSVFTGFSWRWYQALVNDNRLVEGFFLSLNVALLSATLATILATDSACRQHLRLVARPVVVNPRPRTINPPPPPSRAKSNPRGRGVWEGLLAPGRGWFWSRSPRRAQFFKISRLGQH